LIVDLPTVDSRAMSVVSEAIEGGVTCIQLRDKRGSMSEIDRVAKAIRPHLLQAGVPLVVNDRLDVAIGVGADGVHVGQTDESVSSLAARAAMQGVEGLPIGVSVTTTTEGHLALEAGAAYLSVSPVFGTASKPDAPPPTGLEGIRALRAEFPDTPMVAIGGIGPSRVAGVVTAGADGVAFISAAQRGESVSAAVREVAQAVAEAKAKTRLGQQVGRST